MRQICMRDVLYLFPQLALSPGGIQTVNEDTLRVMTRIWPDARHRVLLYRNRTAPGSLDVASARVDSMPCGMRSKRLARLKFAAVFAGMLLLRRPDLVVVGHVNLGPLAWLAKLAFGVPYIVWTHGIEVWRLRGRMRVASLRRADRVVTVSRYTAAQLAQLDPTLPASTVIVPPAVRDRFRPGNGSALRHRLGLAAARVLLTVARVEGHKGCDTVLRALPRVLRRVPDIRYLVAGEGQDLPRLRALADRLGVTRAVVFAGPVPDRDLPDYYNACDLFVMPSRREGFGIVFVEALACGKPVVAGNAGGSGDAVLQGGLGRLVEPDDADQVAQAILDFIEGSWPPALTDPARLRQMCLDHFGFAAFDRRMRILLDGMATCRRVARPSPAGMDGGGVRSEPE